MALDAMPVWAPLPLQLLGITGRPSEAICEAVQVQRTTWWLIRLGYDCAFRYLSTQK